MDYQEILNISKEIESANYTPYSFIKPYNVNIFLKILGGGGGGGSQGDTASYDIMYSLLFLNLCFPKHSINLKGKKAR